MGGNDVVMKEINEKDVPLEEKKIVEELTKNKYS